MLVKKYTNCLNFEHTVFLTEEYIDYLLTYYGFELIEKDYFRNDHSIFYCYEYTGIKKIKKLDQDLYNENLNLYQNYIQFHTDLIKNLNNKINNSNDNVFLFGAHIFSQYLLAFGLNQKKIISIIDNDKNKHFKRLYGTNLNVYSPKY